MISSYIYIIALQAKEEHKEELEKIASILRKKEVKLKDKSNQLERRLEMSESTCSRLMEENGELKTEIESLETEISEVRTIKSKYIALHFPITFFINI